ncbi:MAG: acylneuraminate cytidylyltransferase family protein [Selenomonadaceae bacterium]|nr:acylneuraminate cytidylyltransferase family protein [Selenomonadaceae bacterium]
MYNEKKILAIVPARGGSKGVPRKNIREFCGKPLIAWTLEQAAHSKYIDTCVVSTEDAEIKAVAEKFGGLVPFMRPAELARDESPSVDAIIHAMNMMPGYDVIVVLQVTSPLRTSADIDGAIEYCFEKGAQSCISLTEAATNPYWTFVLDDSGQIKRLLKIPYEQSYRRQVLPKVYQPNGAVYIATAELINRTRGLSDEGTIGYLMPAERSWDIDTPQDFEIAQFLMSKALGCGA